MRSFRKFLALSFATSLLADSVAFAGIEFHDLYAMPDAVPEYVTYPSGYVNGQQTVMSASYYPARALLCTLENPQGVDLTPPGQTASIAYGTNGIVQVGSVGASFGETGGTAYLWHGTADSGVNMKPSFAAGDSAIYYAGPHTQVGYVQTASASSVATVWTGSAGSAVALPMGTAKSTVAFATNDSAIVGYEQLGTDVHAAYWSSSSSAPVDLDPSDTAFYSAGLSVDGNRVSGVAENRHGVGIGDDHATLWTIGATISAQDLNPTGRDQSYATSIEGNMEVGSAENLSNGVASNPLPYLWYGTAASAINLQSYASASMDSGLAAYIDGDTIYGIEFDESDGFFHAVSWTVPEPSSFLLIILPIFATITRRSW